MAYTLRDRGLDVCIYRDGLLLTCFRNRRRAEDALRGLIATDAAARLAAIPSPTVARQAIIDNFTPRLLPPSYPPMGAVYKGTPMPLGPGVRYRVVQTSKGPVRLAFRGGKVIESTNLKTKKTHTPKEFARDRKNVEKGVQDYRRRRRNSKLIERAAAAASAKGKRAKVVVPPGHGHKDATYLATKKSDDFRTLVAKAVFQESKHPRHGGKFARKVAVGVGTAATGVVAYKLGTRAAGRSIGNAVARTVHAAPADIAASRRARTGGVPVTNPLRVNQAAASAAYKEKAAANAATKRILEQHITLLRQSHVAKSAPDDFRTLVAKATATQQRRSHPVASGLAHAAAYGAAAGLGIAAGSRLAGIKRAPKSPKMAAGKESFDRFGYGGSKSSGSRVRPKKKPKMLTLTPTFETRKAFEESKHPRAGGKFSKKSGLVGRRGSLAHKIVGGKIDTEITPATVGLAGGVSVGAILANRASRLVGVPKGINGKALLAADLAGRATRTVGRTVRRGGGVHVIKEFAESSHPRGRGGQFRRSQGISRTFEQRTGLRETRPYSKFVQPRQVSQEQSAAAGHPRLLRTATRLSLGERVAGIGLTPPGFNTAVITRNPATGTVGIHPKLYVPRRLIPSVRRSDARQKAAMGSRSRDRRKTAKGVLAASPELASLTAYLSSLASTLGTYRPLTKSSTDRIVKGVVYAPPANRRDVDKQDQWARASTIRKKAYGFLTGDRIIGIGHLDGTEGKGEVVESYIHDGPPYTVDGPHGPETVPTGAWVLAVRVDDDDTWARIEAGDLQGWSEQGSTKLKSATPDPSLAASGPPPPPALRKLRASG